MKALLVTALTTLAFASCGARNSNSDLEGKSTFVPYSSLITTSDIHAARLSLDATKVFARINNLVEGEGIPSFVANPQPSDTHAVAIRMSVPDQQSADAIVQIMKNNPKLFLKADFSSYNSNQWFYKYKTKFVMIDTTVNPVADQLPNLAILADAMITDSAAVHSAHMSLIALKVLRSEFIQITSDGEGMLSTAGSNPDLRSLTVIRIGLADQASLNNLIAVLKSRSELFVWANSIAGTQWFYRYGAKFVILDMTVMAPAEQQNQ